MNTTTRTTVRRAATTAVLAGAAVLTAAPAFAGVPPEDTGAGSAASQNKAQVEHQERTGASGGMSARPRRRSSRWSGRCATAAGPAAGRQHVEPVGPFVGAGDGAGPARRWPGRRCGRVHRVPVPAPRSGRCSHRLTRGGSGRVPGVHAGIRPRYCSHHRPWGWVALPLCRATTAVSEGLDRRTSVRCPEGMAGTTPFVGRRGEATVLSAAFDGTGHEVVLVTGDAGIGKNRLLAEVIAAAPGRAGAGRCRAAVVGVAAVRAGHGGAGAARAGPGRPRLDRA